MGWQSGGGVTPDATTTSKGIIELAGDLSGTAAAPTVPGKAALVHTHAESDVTSLVTDLASMVRNTLMTTKGDLLVASAANTPARLGVGSDGQIPMADSTQVQGVKWATAVAVGSATVSTLETTTSTSITDLATVGPTVNITIGPLGIAIVTAEFSPFGTGSDSVPSMYVTGAVLAFIINWDRHNGSPALGTNTVSSTKIFTGLTPGAAATFKAQYASLSTGTGAAAFSNRYLGVVTF